ncbi:MAG: phosphotransferase, partial [Actinomycetota bacterium]|nr:phosphotransferase [Actinomycetota bacterium]
AGLRPGLVQRLPGLRVALCVPRDAPAESAGAATLPGALRRLLEAPELVVAAGLGDSEPNRKPVLQLLDPAGGIRGFAKVGWNDYTRAHVETEVAALDRLTADPPRRFGTPTLVGADRWGDLRVCVSSPLPPAVRPYPAASGPPPLAVTRELAGRGEPERAPLGASRYWYQLRERLAATPPDERRRRVVEACIRDLADRAGAVRMGFGAWHGDWSPWNMGWVGPRLYVWDWEHGAPCVPLGFDLLHFEFQVAFELRGRGLDEAVSRVAARGPGRLAHLGVAPAARRATVVLYLLELLCRSDEGMRAGVGRDARFYPAVLDVLGELCTGRSPRS